MPIDTILRDGITGLELYNCKPYDFRRMIATTSWAQINGVFKTVTNTSATTTIVAEPNSGGAILLTEMMLSGEKKNSSTITVQITDGSQTETVFIADVSDGPVAMAIAFNMGKWIGWKDARVELVTDSVGSATLAIGYAKVSVAEEYAIWNARR